MLHPIPEASIWKLSAIEQSPNTDPSMLIVLPGLQQAPQLAVIDAEFREHEVIVVVVSVIDVVVMLEVDVTIDVVVDVADSVGTSTIESGSAFQVSLSDMLFVYNCNS
jgi:hypothetical protein